MSNPQTTKTVSFCKRHDRPLVTGADCPLCHDAGIATDRLQKIHFSDLPKGDQKQLLEALEELNAR